MITLNFEAHFNEEHVKQAKSELVTIKGCLDLIPVFTQHGEIDNAQKMSIKMLKSLSELDRLARKKRSDKRMYLHYLLNHPTGWYPNE